MQTDRHKQFELETVAYMCVGEAACAQGDLYAIAKPAKSTLTQLILT